MTDKVSLVIAAVFCAVIGGPWWSWTLLGGLALARALADGRRQ